jgi:DNA mismatch repair protein MLH1
VDWASEKGCFETCLRELAYFYTPAVPSVIASSSGDGGDVDVENIEGEEKMSSSEKATRWQIQHVLFPAMRRYFSAPKTLLDRDVVQIASLPDLYRVFERC